jgi:tRNA A-37 threonylcarbamoyl transferase component Bud32
VRVVADPEGGTFRKQADTPADRERLRSEAGVLMAVAHPGVVRLIAAEGEPPDELIFGWVEGGDFGALEIEDQEVLAGVGAAIATTLADIHDLGVVHGSIGPAHVLIDPDGRPVLCSFGAARRASSSEPLTDLAGADTAALASMLLSRLPSSADTRVRATLRGVVRRRGRSRQVDARGLARELIRRVPGARLPGARLPGPGRPPGKASDGEPTDQLDLRRLPMTARRWTARATIACVAAVAIAATAATLLILRPTGSDRTSRANVARCPPVDLSCRPVDAPSGVIATGEGRFRVSAPPRSIVVMGRWDCQGEAFPAVAETSTGSVWLFDSWPGPGQSRAARLVARVREVSGLAVIPTPAGCDLLRITRTGQEPLTIRSSRT